MSVMGVPNLSGVLVTPLGIDFCFLGGEGPSVLFRGPIPIIPRPPLPTPCCAPLPTPRPPQPPPCQPGPAPVPAPPPPGNPNPPGCGGGLVGGPLGGGTVYYTTSAPVVPSSVDARTRDAYPMGLPICPPKPLPPAPPGPRPLVL